MFGEVTKRGTIYPAQTWQEIAKLEKAVPGLAEARLRPIRRGTGAGKYAEGWVTGTPKRGTSFGGNMKGAEIEGGKWNFEIDDIRPNGELVDSKDWRSPTELRESALSALEEHLGEEGRLGDAEHAQKAREALERRVNRNIEDRLFDAKAEMEKQSRFAQQYGLPGVEWIINDAEWFEMLESARRDLGLENVRITPAL
jgi:hypothetical protein